MKLIRLLSFICFMSAVMKFFMFLGFSRPCFRVLAGIFL